MNSFLRNRGLGLIPFAMLSAVTVAQIGNPPIPPPTGGFPAGTFPGSPPMAPPPPVIRSPRTPHDWVATRVAEYRVVGISSSLKDYRQKYNQVGRVIHPGFRSDRLAVVELEIKNLTDHPLFPPVFMAALTDTDGVRGTDPIIDTRQRSIPTEYPNEGRRERFAPAEIAPGQSMKLALVFSVSPKAKPVAIEFAPANFRDMPFGRMPPRPGGPPSPPGQPERRFGPRPVEPGMPPLESVRVYIDLSKF